MEGARECFLINETLAKLKIGNSAVNYMALARGPAADFDEWANIVGEDGWKWRNILPLMKEVRVIVRAFRCVELRSCSSLRSLTRSYLQI